mgnify:CR=1 FL=1
MSGILKDNEGRSSGLIKEVSSGSPGVTWQTGDIKTGNFTAETSKGYFCNTNGGSFTATLPASPSAGDIVAFKDYGGDFDTNALTVGRNSSKIEGGDLDAVLQAEGDEATFIYVDGTAGWKVINHAKKDDVGFPVYITATGGSISTSGNFKIHTFTSNGTFTVCSVGNSAGSNTVDYLIVAGGGGGNPGPSGGNAGGGGGGGFRATSGTTSGSYQASPSPLAPSLTNPVSAVPVNATSYPIVVGAGGGAGSNQGSTSSGLSISSAGGGYGAPSSTGNVAGGAGGSGGGGSTPGANSGAGNTPPVSPPQGNPGGTGPGGAGGGGMGGTGGAYGSSGGGAESEITASPVYYSGGGYGGGQRFSPGGHSPGPNGRTGIGTAGAANTGAGGAAGSESPAPSTTGTAGGSGIVVIRYKYQ